MTKKPHPEDFCDLCDGRNVVWHANSPLWNEVIEVNHHRGIICCPLCFVEIAEKQGQGCTSWRICRDTDDPIVDQLRAEIGERVVENKQLMAFADSWSGHDPNCDCLDEGSPRTDCTCGYEKARDAVLKI